MSVFCLLVLCSLIFNWCRMSILPHCVHSQLTSVVLIIFLCKVSDVTPLNAPDKLHNHFFAIRDVTLNVLYVSLKICGTFNDVCLPLGGSL